jgi:hypothetical protein
MLMLSYPVELTGSFRFRIGWFRKPVLEVERVTKCVRNEHHYPSLSDPVIDGYSWSDAKEDDVIRLGLLTSIQE